jgi:hypothetical protein
MPRRFGTRRALLGGKMSSILNILASIPGYLVSWPLQELSGAVAVADNVAVPSESVLASSAYPGAELHTEANAASDPNGNEANATTGWTGIGTFTSDSSVKQAGDYSLKLVAGANGDRIYKDIETDWGLVVGKSYRLSFYARHLGSGGDHTIGLGATTSIVVEQLQVLGNTDTSFTQTVATFTHSANTKYFISRETNATNDGGVYLDAISCVEVNPLNGEHTGVTVGTTGQYRVPYMASYDGTTSKTDLTSTEYNSIFDPTQDFTKLIVIQKTTWDTTERGWFMDYVDANNYIYVYDSTTQDQVVFEFMAGGTLEQITWDSSGTTDLILVDVGRDSDVFKARVNGVSVGTAAIAGTFAGNFDYNVIGAKNTTPTNVHLGKLAYAGNYSEYVSDANMLKIKNSMGIPS